MIARASDLKSQMLHAALRYAAQDWRVFPLAVCSKVPMIAKADGGRGYLDATSDRAQILAWWTRWPDANIGVATGATSGFDVLDVDPRHGGEETVEALVAAHGPLPETAVAITGSGGRHVLFRSDSRVRCSAGRLGVGLDVRGNGGYIAAPPSVHPNGRRYAWRAQDVELAPWPSWLLDLILPSAKMLESAPRQARSPWIPGATHYAVAVLRRACEVIEAAAANRDHRHDTLRARARTVAGFVASGELAEDIARECLLDAWARSGLEHRRREAERTIDWAFTSGKAAPLAAPEPRR